MKRSFPTEAELESFIDRLLDLDVSDLENRLNQNFMAPIAKCAIYVLAVNNAITMLTHINSKLIVRLALAENESDLRANLKASL